MDIKFYPEDAYRSMSYAVEPAPVIVTASYGATTKERVFTAAALNRMEVELVK